MAAGARAGFVARGVIYLLVGLLALRIAFSDSGGKQADRGGAIAEIAEKPFGGVLLWVLGVALAGMALWRLSEAVFGQAGPDGDKPAKRAMAAGRAVFYGFVSYSVLSYAAGDKGSGSGSSDQQTADVTAKALEWPGGQWIVGTAGAVVVGAGLWIGVRAVMRKYHKHLKMSEMTKRVRRAVDFTGVFGGAVRGIVFATAGGFAVAAAVQHEPGRAKGMDDTLRSFAETPAGPWLLALIALGLAAFGMFSWANARWRKV
ncbi:membrane protein [Streptomyces clavifer]|nr:membrane protein [Streptomyces clavifer]